MQKRIKKSDLYVGQLVVVTDHPETQVYTVAAVGEGNVAILQWMEGTSHCSQGHDAFSLSKPTLEQIEYSIAANGALLSVDKILEWA
jgi:hypothetical protein